MDLEPRMRNTRLEYSSKKVFTASLKKQTCDELFPESQQHLVVINGYEITPKIPISANNQEDPNPKTDFTSAGGGAISFKEYTYFTEHKILLVPYHSKRHGFDMDLSKRYEVPCEIKFIIEKPIYQHKFLLRLQISRRPQHYGLIFTFSENSNGHARMRIKTLLTVYRAFQIASNAVYLEPYDTSNLQLTSCSRKDHNDDTQSKNTQLTKAASNAVQVLTDNLSRNKLVDCGTGGSFITERNVNFNPQTYPFSNKKYFHFDHRATLKKKARKNQLQKDIKFLLRDELPQNWCFDGSF